MNNCFNKIKNVKIRELQTHANDSCVQNNSFK